jgi:6-pyruvoyltetrahydropterin/6-carboxytetrahydropterin synthase
MVLDYDAISVAIEPLREQFLDHHFLNETLPVLPTAENIARWIYEMLRPTFGAFLHAVRVRETEKTSALYMERIEQ